MRLASFSFVNVSTSKWCFLFHLLNHYLKLSSCLKVISQVSLYGRPLHESWLKNELHFPSNEYNLLALLRWGGRAGPGKQVADVMITEYEREGGTVLQRHGPVQNLIIWPLLWHQLPNFIHHGLFKKKNQISGSYALTLKVREIKPVGECISIFEGEKCGSENGNKNPWNTVNLLKKQNLNVTLYITLYWNSCCVLHCLLPTLAPC